MKKVAVITVGLLVISVFAVLSQLAVGAADNPTREYLSAALQDQIAACGLSLVVEYSTVRERSQNKAVLERSEEHYRYTRNSDAMRIDTIKDGKVTKQAFHNRRSNEYRLLSEDGPGSYAIQGFGISDPFVNSDFFETSLYFLNKKPLYQWILSAVDSGTTEIVDGADCLRLLIPSGIVRPARYVVWLDPAVGYNPRRIDVVHSESRVTVIKYTDYRSLGETGWFPMKMTLEYSIPKYQWDIRIVSSVTKVTSGAEVATEIIRPVFPSGTLVYAGGGEFIQP
ncbi:MAG: hypothetical protein ACYC64_16445 [Armatimonadota bacterium]